MVCLGGYGTHWVPSVQLDELCVMLWDMARYYNYDIRSPYNRDAALWVANQTAILFRLIHGHSAMSAWLRVVSKLRTGSSRASRTARTR